MHSSFDLYLEHLETQFGALDEAIARSENESAWRDDSDSIEVEFSIFSIAFHLRKLSDHCQELRLNSYQLSESSGKTISLLTVIGILIHSIKFDTSQEAMCGFLEVKSKDKECSFSVKDFAEKARKAREMIK